MNRRAQENKGVLEKLEKEKMLLRRELKDRILTGKLFYKPKVQRVLPETVASSREGLET